MNRLPKAIIFDWDNTIVDTWPIIHLALEATFKTFNKPFWSFEHTKNNVHLSLKDSFPQIFGDQTEEAAQIYYDNYTSNSLNKLTVLEGAQELLELISKEYGIYTAVLSNKKGEYLRREAELLDLSQYFKILIGSLDTEFDKPSIIPLQKSLSLSNFNLDSNIWMVGDSIIDMECAYNANITPILYGESQATVKISSLFPPKIHFTDYKSFTNHMQNLANAL